MRRFLLLSFAAHVADSLVPLTRRVVREPITVQSGGAGLGRDRRTQDEVPVYGDFRELAYYYADVFIGTPPQRFTVISDTGSTLMAVPCLACTECGQHLNPPFNPAASSTARAVRCGTPDCTTICSAPAQCPYRVSYAEGSSLSGELWRDRVFLGGADASSAGAHSNFTLPAFRFGCHLKEGGLFTTQTADGILGLGSGPNSIIHALISAGDLAAPVFSLCLSFVGGAMALGAIDEGLHLAPAQWGPLSAAGFYVVRVEGVSLVPSPALLGGPPGPSNGWGLGSPLSARLPAGGMNSPHTIVDSGTTFMYVPSDTFNALRGAVEAFCRGGAGRCVGQPISIRHESLCYTLTPGGPGLETFPGLVVELQGGVAVDVPPEHLFIDMGWDNGAYCLGVYDNGQGGGVLGGNAMMGHDVIFDLTPGAERLGWAPSQCALDGASPPHFAPPPAPPVAVSPISGLLGLSPGAAIAAAAALICAIAVSLMCCCAPGSCELHCWRLTARFEALQSSEDGPGGAEGEAVVLVHTRAKPPRPGLAARAEVQGTGDVAAEERSLASPASAGTA